MDFFGGLCLLGFAWLLYRSWKQGQRHNEEIKQLGFHAAAVVRSYQEEHVRVAGSWQWLEYPYVEYTNRDGDTTLERLKYAQSSGRPFALGETVGIVRYDGILYYRKGLEEGNHLLLILALGALLGGLVTIGQSL